MMAGGGSHAHPHGHFYVAKMAGGGRCENVEKMAGNILVGNKMAGNILNGGKQRREENN